MRGGENVLKISHDNEVSAWTYAHRLFDANEKRSRIESLNRLDRPRHYILGDEGPRERNSAGVILHGDTYPTIISQSLFDFTSQPSLNTNGNKKELRIPQFLEARCPCRTYAFGPCVVGAKRGKCSLIINQFPGCLLR